MRLTPTERDRLLIFTAAQLARARRDRGLLLNVPEATAVISDAVCEAARDGARLEQAVDAGRNALSLDEVLPGVGDIVTEVWVEAVFDDGSRLVVVPEPVAGASLGNHAPGAAASPAQDIAAEPEVRLHLDVENTSDVPISITSHFHFFEVNPRLRFDRAAAYGCRLAIASGSTIRFEPHALTKVSLTPISGSRTVIGFSGLVDGPLDSPGAKEQALQRARATGFLGAEEKA